MDYREALERKVYWEKKTKPEIKKVIEGEKKQLETNSKKFIDAERRYDVLKLTRPYFAEYHDKGMLIMKFPDDDDEKRVIADMMEELIEANITMEQYDKAIEPLVFRISQHKLVKKQNKLNICILSHIYNGDIENSIRCLHKYKDVSHLCIEDVDNIVKYNFINVNGQTFSNENAYLKVCNIIKNKILKFEALIKELTLLKGEVKQILKANKRMIKRND